MKTWMWISVAVALTLTVSALAFGLPLNAAASPSHTSTAASPTPATSSDPNWNTGNFCQTLTNTTSGGKVIVTCVNDQSYTDLWWNFSTPENYVIQVTEQASGDCINLNFQSFYNTITVTLLGSNYACSEGGGVNIALNTEGDTFILNQLASAYYLDLYVYGWTANVNTFLYGSYLSDTVYYIGVHNGLGSPDQICPYSFTSGLPPYNRVAIRSMIALAFDDNLSTIWVDQSGSTVAPYSIPWTPLINGFGTSDTLWYQVTTTVPAGGCSYL